MTQLGYSTKEVAKQFQVSAPRVSQKRREFLDSWQEFQGEETDAVLEGKRQDWSPLDLLFIQKER
jgi:hypothetical protein